MSRKQQIESSITPDLSPIKKELLKYAGERKPVLLYGKDDIEPKKLIMEIHKLNGGIDACAFTAMGLANILHKLNGGAGAAVELEYFSEEGTSTSEDIGKEIVGNSNPKGIVYPVDCLSIIGGKTLYKELVWSGCDLVKDEDKGKEYCLPNLDGLFFKQKGTIFLDNFQYIVTCKEDIECYGHLAQIIRDQFYCGVPTTFNWLVVYTRDLGKLRVDFDFTEPFKKIGLEAEKQGTVTPRSKDMPSTPQGKTESEGVVYNWSTNEDEQEVYSNRKLVAKLPSLQFKLFNTLKRRTGKFVKRETMAGCWSNKPAYESFVTDAICEMESILKKGLGNKENVIDREKDGKNITGYKLLP